MNRESDAKELMGVIRETGNKGASIAGASMSEEDVISFLK